MDIQSQAFHETVKKYLKDVPSVVQTQMSVSDQLVILQSVASRLGLYDGADFLRDHLISSGRFVK